MAQGGLDLGALIELVSGIVDSVKQREDGQKGFSVDYQKLSRSVAALAGRQALGWILSRRESRRNAYDEALDILRTRANIPQRVKQPKKKSRILPTLIIGALLSLAGYLLVMKPEQRQALFNTIDHYLDQAIGLANEIQGKPYSRDYEKKSS